MGFFHRNWDEYERRQAELIESLPSTRTRPHKKPKEAHAEPEPPPQLEEIIRKGPFALVWVNPNPPS